MAEEFAFFDQAKGTFFGMGEFKAQSLTRMHTLVNLAHSFTAP